MTLACCKSRLTAAEPPKGYGHLERDTTVVCTGEVSHHFSWWFESSLAAEPPKDCHQLERDAYGDDSDAAEPDGEPVCTGAKPNHPLIHRKAAEGTTLMIRNIPCRYLKTDVADILDQIGFRGTYDAIHVPTGRRTRNSKQVHGNFGYCFVNFTDAWSASEFVCQLSGKTFGMCESNKKCEVSLGRKQAGSAGRFLVL